MRLSKLFSQTRRETPSEAETVSQQLLLRAGFIRPLSSGIFSYLPLAQRSLVKIADIMREEINAIGGQEISMPVVHPAKIWKETNRWQTIGSELGRFKDRNEHDMVLAMTHEEVVADLVRNEIHSYRQLPALIYHIQTKWRDDPRPRAGLIHAREFTMLDSYSLDSDKSGLDQQYQAHFNAYTNIFKRCSLPVVTVQSDVGAMGGKTAHEFMYLTPIGEDVLLFCENCGYAANQQVARFNKPEPPQEKPVPMKKVATPEKTTIEELEQFLDMPSSRTAKAVFLMGKIKEDEKLIFVILRGDMELSESKLARIIQASDLRPATEEEIRACGAVPGYASPIGLKGIHIIVDDLIPKSPNLVAGANQEGYHLLNVNYGRDYQASVVADIAAAQETSPCPQCKKPMHSKHGVEVGNTFKLGSWYSEAMGCTFLDKNGSTKYVEMGSYGIGLGRLLACIAEQHHDENGLCWPISVTPYPIHLLALSGKDQEILASCEKLYHQLTEAGLEPLYDDRQESPGVKFKDADLIGVPLRITVSARSIQQGGVEFKLRNSREKHIIHTRNAVTEAQTIISNL